MFIFWGLCSRQLLMNINCLWFTILSYVKHVLCSSTIEIEDLTLVLMFYWIIINKLRKSDKMWGLPSILLLFCNVFNKFNNTQARMLDSIYHMKLRLLKNCIFGVKTSIFCHHLCNVIMDVITSHYEICQPLVVYWFYCPFQINTLLQLHFVYSQQTHIEYVAMTSLPDATSCDKHTI